MTVEGDTTGGDVLRQVAPSRSAYLSLRHGAKCCGAVHSHAGGFSGHEHAHSCQQKIFPDKLPIKSTLRPLAASLVHQNDSSATTLPEKQKTVHGAS